KAIRSETGLATSGKVGASLLIVDVPPAERPLNDSEGKCYREQYDCESTGVTGLEELEGLVVDIVDQDHRCVRRSAGRHQENRVEDFQRPHKGQHNDEEYSRCE